ncbi:MAG: VOC family protein [Bacteroidota bacterium]
MDLTRTGFILYVSEYDACATFYREVLGLSVLFERPDLTCFAFGGSYLMVERDDEDPQGQHRGHPTCLRLNVPDVAARAEALRQRGVGVDLQVHDWGTVAKFEDPAGNLCAFKDDATFEQQVRDGQREQSPPR